MSFIKAVSYLLGLTGCVFLALSLSGAINWPMPIVTLPFWGVAVAWIFSFIVACAWSFIEGMKVNIEKERMKADAEKKKMLYFDTMKGTLYIDGVESKLDVDRVDMIESPIRCKTEVRIVGTYDWHDLVGKEK